MRTLWGPALLAFCALVPARAQDDGLPARLDLSGTWKVAPAGSVTFLERRAGARLDRYLMRVEGAEARELAASFDGRTLVAELAPPAALPAAQPRAESPARLGAIGELEGREAPSGAGAPAAPAGPASPAPSQAERATWTLETRAGTREGAAPRPDLHVFRAAEAREDLPRAFARRVPAIAEVKLVAISYLSDHGLLRDHDASWEARGDLIREPEWTPARQAPISHTLGTAVTLRLELQVGPAGAAPTRVTLKGDGPGEVDFQRELELAPGKVTVELTSSGALEKSVQELELAIDWSLSQPGLLVAPARTTTRTFVTMGTPEEAGGWGERGFTVRRMSKAVQSVGAIKSLDPHEVVTGVMKRWNEFNLEVAFRNAWELGDETRDPKTGALIGADCQTIVRYTRLLIKQAGVPGQAEFVVIYGQCTDPKKGLESLDARQHMGRPLQWHNEQFPKARDAARERWAAYLIDGAGGINNYEAALRFTHDGRKHYYPGGVPAVMDDPDQVIKVFTSMSWVDLRTGAAQDAIHRYR